MADPVTDPVHAPDGEATVIEEGFTPQFDQPAPVEDVPSALLRSSAILNRPH